MIDTCPSCASHVLYEVELDYYGTNGFRADAYGIVPEVGDTIASCGECANFVVLDSSGAAAGAVTPQEPAPAPVAPQEPDTPTEPAATPTEPETAPEAPPEPDTPAEPAPTITE